MGNKEHFNYFTQGVEVWNRWRRENPEVIPDLKGVTMIAADLKQFDLSRANLSGSILNGCDFTEANLKGADLSMSQLARANLSKADLQSANLKYTEIPRANLAGADLSDSNCEKATFDGSDLTEIRLSRANLSGAFLNRVNLTNALIIETNLSGAKLRSANLTNAQIILTDLSNAQLGRADLSEANLNMVELSSADLTEATLGKASLGGSNLSKAHLNGAHLMGASLPFVTLTEADLSGANLVRVNLIKANLSGAKFNNTDLTYANLVEANVENSSFIDCVIYGVSVWGMKGKPQAQQNLIITPRGEATIMVDNLEVAQFIYMLLNHKKIRDVITTIGEKAVLILGRFTPERKEVLDAIAEKLRELKYLPIIFDFEKIPGRDYTETVKILAGLSKFVIADITAPESVPQESQAIIPDFKIPFVRVIEKAKKAWSMTGDLNLYDWVVKDVIEYPDKTELIKNLPAVVKLAERKHKELLQKKAQNTIETLSIEELADREND